MSPRVMVAGDVFIFTYAARTGLHVRTQGEDFAAQPFGTEWQLGAAAGIRLLQNRLLLGPEVWASTVIADGREGFFDTEATSVEGLVAAKYLFAPSWRAGLGAGKGLSRGLGTPNVRLAASLEWIPEAEEPPPEPPSVRLPVDTDSDGVLDDEDACPNEPGVRHEENTRHGCPRSDRDQDGILDDGDACPDQPGFSHEDPTENGCPVRDADGDGVLDRDDACIDEAGVKTDDSTTNGCPPPKDRDKDGFIDGQDACPNQPGADSKDPKTRGCPKAVIVGTRVRIRERIGFDTANATLRPQSDSILEAVLGVLRDHPGIELLSVEGHTDNRGNAALNLKLSRDRAAAVVQWLVDHGIERTRLTSRGHGAAHPIDTNSTDEGRQNNRRVEFVVKKSSESAESEPAP
jgi:outer membrane protein OmpA-like peptidoglycan-associated protein